MESFFSNLTSTRKIVDSAIVIIISIVVYFLSKKLLDESLNKNKETLKKNPQKATYIKLFNEILRYAFIVIVILIVLQINGVNVTSLITGLGIVGIVVGLALQDALKDIIMGINIIGGRFYQIGDVIKFGDITGRVLSVGIKTTVIKDIYTDDVVYITNRNIDKIVNVSESLYLNVEASYDDKIDKVEEAIAQAIEKIKTYKDVKNCQYLGVSDLADSSIVYMIKINCEPIHRLQIKRDALRCVKKTFDDNNITIPYQQIDINNKNVD